MNDDRASLGLLIAALGAATLAIAVFLPWYGLSITPSGATVAQQQLVAAAEQYGNPTLQSAANRAGQHFDELVGRQIATVSAHQALGHASEILLVLAGVALLASLLRLADMRGLLYATGGQVALLGLLAVGVVGYRILHPPAGAAAGLISLSLEWGIWLALLSAGAVLGGALLARSDRARVHTRPKVGPGVPPLGHDVSSPQALARVPRDR
jgi:hypothetical protein